MTKVLKINPTNPDVSIISLACEVMSQDGIVVYPTDTAYGIGVNAMSTTALRKLYTLKERDTSKPTHVVIRDFTMAQELIIPSETFTVLYNAFFPGPITLIASKQPEISDLLTGNLDTLGVRIPDNPVTKMLSKHFPFPFTTPSANRTGEKTPYSIEDVKRVLDVSKVDIILDTGHLFVRPASTVVDTTSTPIAILREGPISEYELLRTLQT